MSDDGPEWFAPKRYGYGSGLPIAWQGWVIMIGFIAISLALALLLRERPVLFVAALIPLTFTLLVIAAKTTRGGWRWRWGADDK
jgi:hypothetical protein